MSKRIAWRNFADTITSYLRSNDSVSRIRTVTDRDGRLLDDGDLDNTALTGSPTAPTQAINDNSTKISSTAYADRLLLNIFNRQTASYTLVLADKSKTIEMNVAGANNLTVPLNSTVAFDIGTEILLSQYGAGQTTVVATGGVTIRSADSALKLRVRYSAGTLLKVGTDEWYLFGDLTV